MSERKKRRIIINIDSSDISDDRALDLVKAVVEMGRISETAGRKHYCHVSKSSIDGTSIHAFKRTETTDTFTIIS